MRTFLLWLMTGVLEGLKLNQRQGTWQARQRSDASWDETFRELNKMQRNAPGREPPP